MAKRHKKQMTVKRRNFVAIAAKQRSGAGRHKDRKKEASKKACRKQIETE